MDLELAARLQALPRLDPANAQRSAKPCKICGASAPLFDVTDFWKGSEYYPFGASGITVAYYRCGRCGFMFTPLCDDWTADDFRRHIYNDDYGQVDAEYESIRPARTAEHMAEWLSGFAEARVLDYGAGSLVFAGRMRSLGFSRVESYDPFSQPARPTERFDVITCFEVIEHSPTPIQTIADMASFLAEDGCILIGESLQPPEIGSVRCNWWYCMPRNGHISLFSDTALALAARRAGLLFHPGTGLHAMTRPAGGRFAALGERIAAPLFPFVLTAPREGGGTAWHAAESFSGTATRWSARAELTWRVALPLRRAAARVRVIVPFALEVQDGFAAASRFFIDGGEAQTRLDGRALVGEAAVAGADALQVILRTPEPIRPATLRDSPDQRQLGLAVPCG